MNTANITCYISLSWNKSMTSGWYSSDVHDTDPAKNVWWVALEPSDTKKNIDDSSGVQVERSLCLYRRSALDCLIFPEKTLINIESHSLLQNARLRREPLFQDIILLMIWENSINWFFLKALSMIKLRTSEGIESCILVWVLYDYIKEQRYSFHIQKP